MLASFGSYGEVNASALIALGYKNMRVCTAASGCTDVDLTAPSDPATAAAMKEFQPAVIFSGGMAPQITIAPYGIPEGISSTFKAAGIMGGVGILAGVIGAGLLIHGLLK